MMDRITAKAVAVILCGALVSAPAAAQNQNAPPAGASPQAPASRSPSINYGVGFLGAYTAGSVSQTPFT
ncbi:MAG TPA: hypothetical protein VG345_08405, partial [Bryobacteraceae bacterium]|nr:hypothetical protein [Bryobacteraceae bacterium]